MSSPHPAPVSADLPVLANRAEARAAARALSGPIRARAAQAEADRRIPDETIAEITDSGLFGLATPKVFGGSQLGQSAFMEVTAELAQACGSTGWIFGVVAGHNRLLGVFPEAAQREVFADTRALTSTVFRLAGEVTPAPGGYRLKGGQGRFCSGIDHAAWVIVGNAVRREGEPPAPGYFLLPRAEVEVIDDWRTLGMRGTGSRSIRIADAFIPEHRAVMMSQIIAGEAPGMVFHASPVYRAPMAFLVGTPLVGAPLGMARAALELFAEPNAKKLAGFDAAQAGEQGALFERIASVSAEIDACAALVFADLDAVDAMDDPLAMTSSQKARVIRDLAFAGQSWRRAATRLFEAAGGSAIYDGSPLQRVVRDVNSATGHTVFGWDDATNSFSRTLLGLPPSRFMRR